MSDFAEVRRLVAVAARKTYADLRAGHPGERFYAFALYDSDDATGPDVSANSEEQFDQLLAQHRAQYEKSGRRFGPREVASYRWGTAEWGYEGCGDAAGFGPVHELLESLSEEASGRDAHPEFRAHAFAALVGALRDLDRDGVFGTGVDREAITLFVSISDSADAEWLERESARLANPPGVFTRFEREALAPPPEPGEGASGDERYEWGQYQWRLTQSPGETHKAFMGLVASWGG